jgi:uncharacterized membrane protein
MSESKQWMTGDDYCNALDSYIQALDETTRDQLLSDFIYEYMENHMTNEQIQQFIDTGAW